MRSDTLQRHMKKHEKKSNGIEEAGSSRSGVCDKVGKHKQAECRICLKTMRSDTLKRHMKTHEKKQCSIDDVNEKIEYNSTIDDIALENKIMRCSNEYQRKLELGRKVKDILLKNDVATGCLEKGEMEALELFENRGQVKEIEAVEWRPWQMDILKYVNEPTKRRIIWVVGEKGNEGKTFFQDKIEEQYGRHRVCTMSLTESSKDILHIMRKCVDTTTTDIFLFNIVKSVYTNDVNYKILEDIKDGKALARKFNSKMMRFKTPNVIIVFSNMYPDTREFSEDRWLIFKINTKMMLEEVTTEKIKKKEEVKAAQKSYMDWRKKTVYDRIIKY